MSQSINKYNNGKWTEARFKQFIVNILRQGSSRWPPRNEVRKEARDGRGKYWCAGYKKKKHLVPITLPPKKGRKSRINNTQIDHIDPVISPTTGFVDWNTYIERMFVDSNKLQLLCNECHKKKTADERKKRNV